MCFTGEVDMLLQLRHHVDTTRHSAVSHPVWGAVSPMAVTWASNGMPLKPFSITELAPD
jgi:hypothetical protein